jgi:hypothetical protein
VGGWERISTLTEWQNQKGMQRPMRILLVSEGYKNCQDGALSNNLTDVVRECACGVKAILLICCWSTEIVAGVLDAELSLLTA